MLNIIISYIHDWFIVITITIQRAPLQKDYTIGTCFSFSVLFFKRKYDYHYLVLSQQYVHIHIWEIDKYHFKPTNYCCIVRVLIGFLLRSSTKSRRCLQVSAVKWINWNMRWVLSKLILWSLLSDPDFHHAWQACNQQYAKGWEMYFMYNLLNKISPKKQFWLMAQNNSPLLLRVKMQSLFCFFAVGQYFYLYIPHPPMHLIL